MPLETVEPIDPSVLHTALVAEATELRAAIDLARQELTTTPSEPAAAALELQGVELVQLERAIARHEAGMWNRCERCGAQIREERLHVLPTAVHCGPCAIEGAGMA